MPLSLKDTIVYKNANVKEEAITIFLSDATKYDPEFFLTLAFIISQ